MSIVLLIFTSGSGLLLVISGVLKVIAIHDSAKSIENLYPVFKKNARKLGYLFPFFELLLGCLLIFYTYNIWVNSIAMILFSVFIIINTNAILKHDNTECFCFGNLIKSRMGFGGLIQSFLLLLCVIPNIFSKGFKISSVFMFKTYDFEHLAITVAIIIWALSLILFRITIDKVFAT